MKGPVWFEKIAIALINVVLGLGISLGALLYVQNLPGNEALSILTPSAFVQASLLAFFIGYTIGSLVPAFDWGIALAQALRIRARLGVYAVQSVTLGVAMGVLIGFFVAFITNFATQGMGAVIGFYVTILPLIVVLAIMFVLVFMSPILKVASRISGFDPERLTGAKPTVDGADEASGKAAE